MLEDYVKKEIMALYVYMQKDRDLKNINIHNINKDWVAYHVCRLIFKEYNRYEDIPFLYTSKVYTNLVENWDEIIELIESHKEE
jgi:hypothetical protein